MHISKKQKEQRDNFEVKLLMRNSHNNFYTVLYKYLVNRNAYVNGMLHKLG